VSVIADLVRAGVDPDLIEKVHAEILAASKTADEQAERRRAADRERKRLKRLRNSADSADNADADPSSLLPSPTPPTNNSSPQSSLRSENIRAREAFDRFFAIYPKRINRKAALARWLTAVKAGVDPERMIAAAERYAEHMRFTEPQFIKAPDAWLNGAKYDDELPAEPLRPRSRGSPGGTTGFAAVLDHLEGRTNEPADHPMRDITPGAANADRSHDPTDLFEPAGRVSRVGEVVDFCAARADVGGQAVAFGPTWRASG
jgi:hypothetical protein